MATGNSEGASVNFMGGIQQRHLINLMLFPVTAEGHQNWDTEFRVSPVRYEVTFVVHDQARDLA